MEIPEGYNHKATSEGFTGANKVVVYYSGVVDRYLVVFESTVDEDADDAHVFVNATQLELFVHAGGDVLHDAAV
jgi:hypothetical protein